MSTIVLTLTLHMGLDLHYSPANNSFSLVSPIQSKAIALGLRVTGVRGSFGHKCGAGLRKANKRTFEENRRQTVHENSPGRAEAKLLGV